MKAERCCGKKDTRYK